MWYYLVDYGPTSHGAAPALPPGVGFLLMAGPGYNPPWGIFSCSTEVAPSEHVHPLPEDVLRTIWAAEHYPPALALARDTITGEFEGRLPTREVFAARYAELLREHMRQQPEAGYLFTEATGDEPGYLTRGMFYWVLLYSAETGLVSWVSSDYFVYQNSSSDFALEYSQLEALRI
jgi:hypothetical protein